MPTFESSMIKSLSKTLLRCANPYSKTIVFDLDETLFSRYFMGLGRDDNEQFSHHAPCSIRQNYYWINKSAWQRVMPSLLEKHQVIFLTASICHDPSQIKSALTDGLLPESAKVRGLTFSECLYFDGNDFEMDRHAPKGEKLELIYKKHNPNNSSKADWILVDDQSQHLESAKKIGIRGIQAGEEGYLHDLCQLTGSSTEGLPNYASYRLSWDSKQNRVIVEDGFLPDGRRENVHHL